MRNAYLLGRTVRVADVCEWIGRNPNVGRNVIKSMIAKSLLKPKKTDRTRHHEFQLGERAMKFLANRM